MPRPTPDAGGGRKQAECSFHGRKHTHTLPMHKSDVVYGVRFFFFAVHAKKALRMFILYARHTVQKCFRLLLFQHQPNAKMKSAMVTKKAPLFSKESQ